MCAITTVATFYHLGIPSKNANTNVKSDALHVIAVGIASKSELKYNIFRIYRIASWKVDVTNVPFLLSVT